MERRIPTLDGWRGIAILMVIFDHLRAGLGARSLPFTRTGTHGVALFFVLSGFLITSRFLAEMQRDGTLSLKSFYIRRFFRLMPAAWLYLVVIGFLIGWHYVVPCLFFFRNFVDPHETALMNAHFWSLSIEEQFYLVWPALLLFARPKRALWIATVAAGIVVIERVIHREQLAALPFAATLQTYLRADAILIGCCAAILLPQLKPFLRERMVWPLAGGFILCLASVANFISCVECLIIALVLCATSINAECPLSRALEWKPLSFIGKISYSLYIWQEIALRFPVHQTVAIIPLRISALAVLALTSYYLIERPLNLIGHRITAKEFPRLDAKITERPPLPSSA